MLLAAPWLPAAISAIAYAVGSLVCHQIPERSFHLAGVQLPVCARCSGIYAGAAIASWVALLRPLRRSLIRRAEFATAPARWIVVVAAVPTALSIVVERAGIANVTNAIRAMTALSLGAGVAFVVTAALATLHYKECAPPRPTVPSHPPRI
jgi:uncharacterized membrane protein